jgi:beta-phosphoglucomutase-like phosphatase (HAD superfamily)
MVVENAPLGVRAAKAAGLFACAVNTGPLPDSALLDEGADLIFSRMTLFRYHWHDLSTHFNPNKK